MPDDKNHVGGRDDSKVAVDQSYELSYLEEKMGVSSEAVREAIQQVDTSREKAEEYLERKKGKV
jgi:hypothetical protein